jgi:hypothetical protein
MYSQHPRNFNNSKQALSIISFFIYSFFMLWPSGGYFVVNFVSAANNEAISSSHLIASHTVPAVRAYFDTCQNESYVSACSVATSGVQVAIGRCIGTVLAVHTAC